jgi:hypothetical protein
VPATTFFALYESENRSKTNQHAYLIISKLDNMHAPVLMLVTAFAASVAAAPIPVTPIESPVEGLAVRDAEAALSPAQMEVLKRSIFERLEEIVPVKRSATKGDENDKRQLQLDPDLAYNDKRAVFVTRSKVGEKRQLELDPDQAYNDKRQLELDPDQAYNDKRQLQLDPDQAYNDKRQLELDPDLAYNDKREVDESYIPKTDDSANAKRQLKLDPDQAYNDKRQLELDPDQSYNDKRQLELDPDLAYNDKA